ncbi:hypothetical protein WG66_009189 [Moniliophthora roreri]|nr:hypothetical protein WG66_009189 [Moniliophthora roreri]
MLNLIEDTYTLFDDNRIWFIDSGPPNTSQTYTTLIILHGGGFTAGGFEGVTALAQSNNLRAVAVNRLGYPGSTLYSQLDLEDLQNGKKESLDRIALVLAAFIKRFIEKEKISKISEGGGMIIMSWSMGSATALSLFSDPSPLDSETYSLLNEHLKHFILYDPPSQALGYPLHPSFLSPVAYLPWTDPEATTLEDKFDIFFHWVSSTYSHDHMQVSSTSLDGYDLRKRTDVCFVDTWSKEQVERCYNTGGLPSDLAAFGPAMQLRLRVNTERALFENKIIPNVKFTYLYAPNSVWLTVWTYHETKRLYLEYLKRNGNEGVRKVEFITMEGASHFIHQVAPEEFMAIVLKAISA